MNLQSLGSETQDIDRIPFHPLSVPSVAAGGLLGNATVQQSRAESNLVSVTDAWPILKLSGPRTPVRQTSLRIEDLKRQKFLAAGKAERVRKALAALAEHQRIHLTPQDWRQVAEDPDLEDQF
ncbi:MAG: hypothetical protein HY735_25975 [Verrucomicrobia bacterium]|nr:hypothetical protein [Verrucomicrobiota bacterium]